MAKHETGPVYVGTAGTTPTVSGNGIQVASGDLQLDAGNIVVTAGNLTLTSGKITEGAIVRAVTATTSAATNGTNATKVTITVKDGTGTAVARITPIRIYLSDSATGAGVTAVTASGTVANDGTAGTDLVAVTAKKVLDVLTDVTGVYKLAITDTAKTQFYPCIVIGQNLVVGTQILTANYG